MRWWLRFVFTLVLAPLVWRLGNAYLANQLGTSWSDLAQQSIPLLGKVYATFTLPALVLCGVLALADLLLHRLGLDLLTVAVSPLVACAVALSIVDLVHEPHVQAAENAVVIAVVYGLVWGLTIRESRPRRAAGREDASTPAAEAATADV